MYNKCILFATVPLPPNKGKPTNYPSPLPKIFFQFFLPQISTNSIPFHYTSTLSYTCTFCATMCNSARKLHSNCKRMLKSVNFQILLHFSAVKLHQTTSVFADFVRILKFRCKKWVLKIKHLEEFCDFSVIYVVYF